MNRVQVTCRRVVAGVRDAANSAMEKAGEVGTGLAIAGGTGLLWAHSEVQAAITIPNTIDVDGLGTSVLATAAPGMVSIVTASTVLFLGGLAILLFRRRSKRIAS